MKKFLLSSLCFIWAGLGLTQANVAFFDFNSVLNDANVSTGNNLPSFGNASITTIGGVTQTYVTGSPSDNNSTDNSGYQTTNYPTQGTNPQTAGIAFNVNTVGYSNLSFECWQRLSNTAANTWVLQYTVDVTGVSTGGNAVWTNATTYTFTPQPTGTGDTWFLRTFDFSTISTLNNNPNVAFRLVSAFDPVTGNYVAARSTSSYGGGTSRFDLLRISEKAPALSIATASNFVFYNESVGTIQVPVTVQNGNTAPSFVVFGTSVYTDATQGEDYTWNTDTLFIPAQTNGIVQFPLTILDDALAERAEKLILKFISGSNALLSTAQNYQIIFIKDNDYQAPTASNELQMSLLTSFSNGPVGLSSAEIISYDSTTLKLYIANSIDSRLDIFDFSNPASPVLIQSVDVTQYGDINSVTVYNGIVAVAMQNANAQLDGIVVFFDENGVFINQVTVGAMPDMITFNNDYTRILTANEGEPSSDYSVDPVGSVSIIALDGGIANLTNANVTTVGFEAYNGQEAALLAQGIRIFATSASVAQDLEPEFITISTDNTKAFIGLQENNALAVIDLATATIDTIYALGYMDYSSGNGLDASDQSGSVLITSAPVKGTFMPDALAFSTIAGQGYVFSANEGDSREFGSVVDAARINSLNLDPTVFVDQNILKNNRLFGRLNALTYSGDTDNDGDFDEIHVLGTRSFSIWNANTGELVFDSKDLIEQITSTHPDFAAFFNASNSSGNANLKNRSDDKGPEPEGVATAFLGGNYYVFVSLERIGGVMAFNVNDPENPVYVGYENNRTLSGSGPDLGAEGIMYISPEASPNGNALILLANEISSTVSVYQVNTCAELIGAEILETTTSFCDGDSTLLVVEPEMGSTIQWILNGEIIADQINDTLIVSTSGDYTAFLTSASFACAANSSNLTIIVNTLPNIEIEASETELCFGNSLTLTATGAEEYTWSLGIVNGVAFEPTETEIYSVSTLDSNGCAGSNEVSITVNTLPNIEIEASETEICFGNALTLTATGAEEYSWSLGIVNGVAFEPTETEIYSVSAVDSNGCAGSNEVSILVNPIPEIDLGADITICENAAPVSINAGSHASYSWSTGATTASINVSTSGSYSVEVSNAEDCLATDTIEVLVESCLGLYESEQNISVYPNPATDVLHVNVNSNVESIARVYDLNGKRIFELSFVHDFTVLLENWSTGTYTLEIQTLNGVMHRRFVKQ